MPRRAHLWIRGYAGQVVCAVHADVRAGDPAVLLLCDVVCASSSAAGMVLLAGRVRLRSCCYLYVAGEPGFAASLLHRGQVIAALGVTGEHALDATGAVCTAAARLSVELGSAP